MRLDGEPVTELDLPAAELDGRVLQVGKRRFLRLAAGLMAVHTALLRLQTEGEGQIVDLTAGLESALRSAGVDDGVVTVFVTGSTAAITTMEYEPGGVQDLQEALERLVPQAPARGRRLRPQHAQPRRQRARAPARVAARPVAGIPLVRGSLVLGTWQQVVLIDFDDRPRERVGPRPDRVLRLLHSALLRNCSASSGPFGSRPGRAILRCPLWEPTGCPGSASGRRSPPTARRDGL